MLDSREILDALGAAVAVLDEQLRIVEANSSAQSLFGLNANHLRGQSISQLLHGSEVLTQTLRRALESTEACALREVAMLPVHGSGVERVVDVYAAPLEKGLLVEIGDATQRQRIHREATLLAQLGGSRSMVRQLAHEIKNPLGGLRGAAQLLDRQLKDEALRDYTKVIIGEADRLAALVDSMLGPNRPPNKEAVNVHELCEHVLRLLRAEASERLMLERDYDPSLPELKLDRNMIVQAMLNLGRNALQAVGESGRIVLRTRALGNHNIGPVQHRLAASVQFEDNGPGVPAEIHDTLFYPLVTGRENGTGLGLAIAQDLVSRHQGLIEFDSVPGHTQFTIVLPIHE